MAQKRILVPFNFTAQEKKSLQFLIETYAGLKDVHITLFHAFAPLPGIDSTGIHEMKKMSEGIAFLSGEKKRKKEGLDSARKFLIQNGFEGKQIDFIFKEKQKVVADEIIDAVNEKDYNILVLSRQPGKVKRMFARSVHTKLFANLVDVTICIPT